MALRKLLFLCFSLLASHCLAHDTWVQPNTHFLRKGDVAHIDLMLGNHGNEHRDFRLASKITLDPCKLELRTPSGNVQDLKPGIVDLGSAPKEGFWSAKYVTKEEGLHTIVHSLDTLQGKTRAIKSAKSYFVVGATNPAKTTSLFAEPLGHDLEVIPLTDPADAAAGAELKVRVDFKKHPLKDARIAFIPRGQVLAPGFDDQFERKTDGNGVATFTPSEGNYLLIMVHHVEPEAKGDGFDKTHFGAALTLCVPQIALSMKE